MRSREALFPGWAGGARAVAPELFRRRDAQVDAQLALLLPWLTPRAVFLDIGSPDCELALRAASYVERVWCVGAALELARAPCNLRYGMPTAPVDVAFTEAAADADSVRPLLKRGAVWVVYGSVLAAGPLRSAGFTRVSYHAAGLKLPGALARFAPNPVTVAHA
jgi:hypothetical protein